MSEKMEMSEKGEVNKAYNNTDNDSREVSPTSEKDVKLNVEGKHLTNADNVDHYPDTSEKDVKLNVEGKHLTDADNVDRYPDEADNYQIDPQTGDLIFQKKPIENTNYCTRVVSRAQTFISDFFKKNKVIIWQTIGVLLLLLFLAYVIYSLVDGGLDGEGNMRLLVCTILGLLLLLLYIGQNALEPVNTAIHDFNNSYKYSKQRAILRWVLYVVSTVLTVTLIIVLVAIDTPKNLLSLAGLAALMVICYCTSYSPSMIEWHPVFWGFSLQFYFAVIILKTQWGYDAFNWLGDRVTEFLEHSDAGAKFVFGDIANVAFLDGTEFKIKNAVLEDGSKLNLSSITLQDRSSVLFQGVYTIHFFAFKVLPVVIFFSAFIGIMFYLGVMKFVVKHIGHFLSFCLGTTPAESLNAAGNIFVGMTESPLLIRPFIGKMTSSELHAVMTGGFATIAGSVLGVYISFGIPANHLLSASVMSAPAALAISKMTYPEIEVPIISSKDYKKMENSRESNLIEAACNGAVMSAKICGAILVNVIAFLSLLKFVNATLTWFGDRAGVHELTFEFLCSYVLYPIALFMGTDTDDCRRVAELIGIKTFTNEFIAFERLSVLLENRKEFLNYTTEYPNSTWHKDGDDIYLHDRKNMKLEKGILDPRSELIATYALCGFSNFGSMGILLGGLTALAPNRMPTMSKLIFRSMLAGNLACFFTACIAGLFYEDFD